MSAKKVARIIDGLEVFVLVIIFSGSITAVSNIF